MCLIKSITYKTNIAPSAAEPRIMKQNLSMPGGEPAVNAYLKMDDKQPKDDYHICRP